MLPKHEARQCDAWCAAFPRRNPAHFRRQHSGAAGEAPSAALRAVTSFLLRTASSAAGWITLYLAVAGFAGFVLNSGGYTSTPVCFPYHSGFGLLETRCNQPALDFAWSAAVGFPRFALVVPALAFSLGRSGNLADAFNLSLLSLPLLACAWVGVRHLCQRRPVVGSLAAAGIVGEVIALATL